MNQAELIEQIVMSVNSLDVSALHMGKATAPGQWYSAMSGTVDKMQAFELGLARSIVQRGQSLQRGAEQAALFNAILTVVILLLVLIATLVVARSLVRPLRRLREGALDIATVQLPERVRLLGEAVDPATSLEVAPIDVLSADEGSARSPARSTRCTRRRCGWRATRRCCATVSTRCSSTCPGAASR